MIPQHILEKLLCFTEEEIDNLNGKNIIDKSIFINESSNIVDYHHLLLQKQQFSVRKHARFCKYPLHKHNYIELMYVYAGQMIHNIDGKDIIIQKGELLLLNQNIEHSIQYCNENDIIFNFIIKPEFLQFLSHLLEGSNDVSNFIFDTLYSYENDGEYLLFKTSHNEIVQSYIDSIITNIYEPSLNNEIELKLLVGLLLTELMNHPECIESYTGDSYEKVLGSSILKYITLNYRSASLLELSSILHQPDYKICKLIKKQTGMTFTQLLQEERLKVTERMLKSTNMPMNDIMEQVGYENISYFYKIFKKKYLITPHKYRCSNKEI